MDEIQEPTVEVSIPEEEVPAIEVSEETAVEEVA